jgi:uncharacterized protein YndB with AHSA1/START domain
MSNRQDYSPGPANVAQVEKGGDKWTLVLVKELRHAPERVWEALTAPAQLREWAPFDVDRNLGTVGSVNFNWVGAPKSGDSNVTRAEAPKVLEYNDMRWELEPVDGGTRLTLWSVIDSRFVAWGAAGWHISLDVLERLMDGEPIGRIAGPEAMQFEGWQRLSADYGKQFGAEAPSW